MRLYSAEKSKRKSKTANAIKQTIIYSVTILTIPLLAQWFLKKTWIYPVHIQTESMSPEIEYNDTVFFIYPHLSTISRGDIIVSQYAASEPVFCKVAGLEGEKIEIIDRIVYINDKPLLDYLDKTGDRTIYPASISNRDNVAPTHLKPGELYCLHTNWDNTLDSRSRGPIPYESIRGRALFQNIFGLNSL